MGVVALGLIAAAAEAKETAVVLAKFLDLVDELLDGLALLALLLAERLDVLLDLLDLFIGLDSHLVEHVEAALDLVDGREICSALTT